MTNLLANTGLDGLKTTGSNIGFNSVRDNVFHYCLFAGTNQNSGEGIGVVGGDTFIISPGYCDDGYRVAVCFMHELGHNILGVPTHFINDPGDSNPDKDHCPNKCTMDRTGTHNGKDVLGYCSSCWAVIETRPLI